MVYFIDKAMQEQYNDKFDKTKKACYNFLYDECPYTLHRPLREFLRKVVFILGDEQCSKNSERFRGMYRQKSYS